jgi:hypothetical protein
MIPSEPFTQAMTIASTIAICWYSIGLAARQSSTVVRQWAIATFCIHAALGLFVWFVAPGLIAGDANVYDSQALSLASVWHGGPATDSLVPGKEAFSVALGGVYWLGGHLPVAGLLLNALAGALLVVIVASTTRRLGGRKASEIAAVIVSLLPSLLWWGSQLLREAFVWVGIAIIIRLAVESAELGVNRRRGAGMVLASLALLALRAPIAAVVDISVLCALLLGRSRSFGDKARWFVLVLAASGVVLVLLPRFPALEYLQSQNVATIARSRNAVIATSNTGFGQPSAPTVGGLIGQLPQTLPLVVLGPLPWQVDSYAWAALIDTASWWFVVVYAVPALLRLPWLKRRAAWICAAPALAILVTLGVTGGNFGLLIRMRAMAIVALAPCSAITLAERLSRRRARANTWQPHTQQGVPVSADTGP